MENTIEYRISTTETTQGVYTTAKTEKKAIQEAIEKYPHWKNEIITLQEWKKWSKNGVYTEPKRNKKYYQITTKEIEEIKESIAKLKIWYINHKNPKELFNTKKYFINIDENKQFLHVYPKKQEPKRQLTEYYIIGVSPSSYDLDQIKEIIKVCKRLNIDYKLLNDAKELKEII